MGGDGLEPGGEDVGVEGADVDGADIRGNSGQLIVYLWPPLTYPRPSVPVAPRWDELPLTRGDS